MKRWLGLATVALLLPVAVGGPPRVAGAAAAASGQAPLTAAQAQALSANVTDKVIVVFKNQLPATPDSPRNATDRAAAVGQVQAGVVHELAQTGARQVKRFQIINAVSATVSPGEATRLTANPAVREVVPDEVIPVTPSLPVLSRTKASGISPLPGACTTGSQVQLDPQAIEDIHAAITNQGKANPPRPSATTAQAWKVAFIADGIDTDNPDFIRANGQHSLHRLPGLQRDRNRAPTGRRARPSSMRVRSPPKAGRPTTSPTTPSGSTVPCNIRILGVAPGRAWSG